MWRRSEQLVDDPDDGLLDAAFSQETMATGPVLENRWIKIKNPRYHQMNGALEFGDHAIQIARAESTS